MTMCSVCLMLLLLLEVVVVEIVGDSLIKVNGLTTAFSEFDDRWELQCQHLALLCSELELSRQFFWQNNSTLCTLLCNMSLLTGW